MPPLSSCVLTHKNFASFLREILLERADRTVEVYEQSGGTWKLKRSASPGALHSFEDVLYESHDMADSPVLIAVRVLLKASERVVGLASLDLASKRFSLAHFVDDERFTTVEALLMQLGCKECIVQGGEKSPEERHLSDVFQRCGVLCSEVPKQHFVSKNVAQDMSRLLRSDEELQSVDKFEEETSSSALAAILQYTDVLANVSDHGSFTLADIEVGRFMRLDAAAARALHVLRSKGDGSALNSLEALLNRTRTPMGRRLLTRWLKQPLMSLDEINERHDVVESMLEMSALRSQLRNEHLRRLCDMERLAHRVQRGHSGLKDIVLLYQSTIRLPYIQNVLEAAEGTRKALLVSKFVEPLRWACEPSRLGKFEQLVENAVDLEALDNQEYLISPSYDTELQELRREKEKVLAQLEDVHHEIARDLKMNTEGAKGAVRLEHSNILGHHLRITKTDEGAVRQKLKKYIQLETRKDGVKFTSPKIQKYSTRFSQITQQYSERQRGLVAKVVDVAATFSEIFEKASSAVAVLDVLCGFAEVAATSLVPYVRPEMLPVGDREISLYQCRHPCVEVQEDMNFIANDCIMKPNETLFQIITGPNMGGKSTFIRQVGVCVLLAQIGCFVPCERARISVRDKIFARVGAGDCQLRGVSTFMAEMLETSAIIKAATSASLIIIDELGRGTSTYDGFGLAWAISEHIVTQIQAPTLFATHFHELTCLRSSLQEEHHSTACDVANYHVSAHIDPDTRKLTMLYQVQPGACDQSFGIHVAEFANFPKEVVDMAKEKAKQLEELNDESDQASGARKEHTCSRLLTKRKRVEGPAADSWYDLRVTC
eukprot:scaffold2926_cov399-Prasinococcus_capsulatus_cf.AAC.16